MICMYIWSARTALCVVCDVPDRLDGPQSGGGIGREKETQATSAPSPHMCRTTQYWLGADEKDKWSTLSKAS